MIWSDRMNKEGHALKQHILERRSAPVRFLLLFQTPNICWSAGDVVPTHELFTGVFLSSNYSYVSPVGSSWTEKYTEQV